MHHDDIKPDGREVISFQVAGQEFCVDVMSVREIRGWSPTTPLPHAPPYVRGVMNLRGAVLPVVDAAVRLGLPASEPTRRSVVVVVAIGRRLVGLLVDSVCEILVAPAGAVQPTPEVAGAVVGFVTGLLAADGRMIALLDLDTVLPVIEADAA